MQWLNKMINFSIYSFMRNRSKRGTKAHTINSVAIVPFQLLTSSQITAKEEPGPLLNSISTNTIQPKTAKIRNSIHSWRITR